MTEFFLNRNADNTLDVTPNYQKGDSITNVLTGDRFHMADPMTGWEAVPVSITAAAATAVAAAMAVGDSSNLVVGTGSLVAVTSATQNTAVGNATLAAVISGSGNTAVGYTAGAATTGSNNVIVGDGALAAAGASANNTVVGYSAAALVTGNGNTIIGYQVGKTALTTGSGNLYIGVSAALDAATGAESNVFRLGNHATNLMHATGINTAAPAFFLDWLPSSTTYANDGAAATGGIAVGQIYRNGSVVMCRIT